MSSSGRFRYALEPVLLRRQWDLDALLLDLSQVNTALSRRQDALEKLNEDGRQAAEDWKRQSASGLIDVGCFARVTHYMQDLAARRAATENEIVEIERQRDALIDHVVEAQRGVEAVELHRDEMKAEFIKQRQSHDFKFADDHWSTLQTRMENHDGRS